MFNLRWLGLIAVCVGVIACGDDDRMGGDDSGMNPDGMMMLDGDTEDTGMVETDAGEDSDVMVEEDAGEADAGQDADIPPVDAGPPSCTNTIQDGDESDVDCGGPDCDPCEADEGCFISSDCASRVCISGICQPSRCSDGIRNGNETGTDCGGGDCPGCGLGEGCMDMDDCDAGICVDNFCVANHCFDSMINSGETDVDCGGPDCGPCMAGQACGNADDCAEMTACIEGFCRTDECADGMMNGDELGVDCGGGVCPGCPDGTMCGMDSDCRSGRCDGDTCTSCSDGEMNGDETDVDCGGSLYRRCYGGEGCMVPGDCAAGVCTAMMCEGGGIFYTETFNSSDGGWTTGGSNSSWAYGAPSGDVIASANTGSMVWVTNPAGDYNNSENSWIQSPSFDLSGAGGDPLLEFFLFFETESCCDEGWVEVSIDGGSSWTKVVDDGNATNWYTNTTNQYWQNTNDGWTMVSAYLTGTAGNADVRIRIVFSSDGSVLREGFAIDDVLIREDVCNNGMQDVGEADVDCGGECDACVDGSMCTANMDCASGRCDTDTCGSCRDGMLNGDEVQIDCGGTFCGLCPGGTPCSDGATCASGVCTGMVCEGVGVFYEEDFETDAGGWSAGGAMPSWAHGAPSNSVISAAANGTNAWVTNLTGDYNLGEDSWIESPPIDLSGAADDPVISFSLIYETENCCDEGWLEVSIDEGMTWTKLVDMGAATNWYDDTTNNEWDGSNGGWVTASNVLMGTAGESDVRLRFRFSADSISVQDEGFGIDDIRIGPSAPDLAVEITPSEDFCSAAKITVTNVGTAPVSFFDLTTNVDGTMDTQRVMAALEPGDSWDTDVMIMSSVSASVVALGDENPDNDMANGAGVAPTPIGAMYQTFFEMNDGGWVSSGTNNSWEWGEPDDFNLSNASSGTNAWMTNLDANYNNDEVSYLVSPCFDMTSATAPQISFFYIHDIEPTNDHTHVEITTDGGMTWTKLGTSQSGVNWYNDPLGNFWDGRNGVAGMWTRASHPLTGAAGASAVRIRFVFMSNASTTDEGFGVDDVVITP